MPHRAPIVRHSAPRVTSAARSLTRAADVTRRSSDGNETYAGHLEVTPQGKNAEVTVHVQFDPPEHVKEEMASRAGSHDAAIQEGLEKALQSIQNQIEGKGGKEGPQSAPPTSHGHDH